MNTIFLIDIKIDDNIFRITNSIDSITYLGNSYTFAVDIKSISFSSMSQFIEMIIHDNKIASEINNKVYHNKTVDIYAINDDKISYYFGGFIASCTKDDNEPLSCIITSKLAMLKREIGVFFSKTCRATFCDSKCGLDVNNFQHRISVIGKNLNTMSLNIDISHLNVTDGIFFVTSGKCKGFQSRILGLKSNTSISLFDNPMYNIESSDICFIVEGCDKTIESCKKYKNVINFRGDPFINEGS